MNDAPIGQVAVERNSMSETNETTNGKKLGLSAPGKLELNKTVETGSVRQSFSHGRSKMVAVEVKKKRVFAPDYGGHMAEVTPEGSVVWEADWPGDQHNGHTTAWSNLYDLLP